MVAPTAGLVVLVPFPFLDLSQAKLRPAVVLADSGLRDWILCQVAALNSSRFKTIVDAVIDILRSGLTTPVQ